MRTLRKPMKAHFVQAGLSGNNRSPGNNLSRRSSVTPAWTLSQHYGQPGLALGLVAAAMRSNKQLFYGSYPITPASDILHELAS